MSKFTVNFKKIVASGMENYNYTGKDKKPHTGTRPVHSKTREFSTEVHGDNAEDLATEFAITNAHNVSSVDGLSKENEQAVNEAIVKHAKSVVGGQIPAKLPAPVDGAQARKAKKEVEPAQEGDEKLPTDEDNAYKPAPQKRSKKEAGE